MAKPYEKLSGWDKQYVDEVIKKNAQSFNQLNKKNQELKSWLLDTKKRILVVSLNVGENRAEYGQLERIIRNWEEEAVIRLQTLMEEYGVIKKALDRQQASVNMIYTANQTLNKPGTDQAIARIAINMKDAESIFEEISKFIATSEEYIRAYIPKILEDQKKRAEKVVEMFDELINIIDIIDILGKKCMRAILNVNTFFFKLT